MTRVRSRRRSLLALALILAGCAYSIIERRGVAADAVRRATERTSLARGIGAERPVDVHVVDPEGFANLLQREAIDASSLGELAAYQDALVALGLWPASQDLHREQAAVAHEEVGGLYVPERRAIYLVRNPSAVPLMHRVTSVLLRRDLLGELLLSHELVHSLQHQAYPELMENEVISTSQDDLSWAIHAALEGDAVRYSLAATGLLLPHPREFSAEIEHALGESVGALPKAPALLRLTMGFPYTHGYWLAYFEASELLERPPISTEQVLHGPKRREPFLAIDLSSLHGSLPPDCHGLHENTVGELGLSVLFRDLADAVSPAAWEGWHGDRYIAARCGGRRNFVWLTVWDSEQDATEFADSYACIADEVSRRAELAVRPAISKSGREVRVSSVGLAPVEALLADRSRRALVASFAELRAHFGGEAARNQGDATASGRAAR